MGVGMVGRQISEPIPPPQRTTESHSSLGNKFQIKWFSVQCLTVCNQNICQDGSHLVDVGKYLLPGSFRLLAELSFLKLQE